MRVKMGDRQAAPLASSSQRLGTRVIMMMPRGSRDDLS